MPQSFKKYLPFCKEEWHVVLTMNNLGVGEKSSIVDGLKRKCSRMHLKCMPTGDPLITDDVRRSKNLIYRMTERVDLVRGCGRLQG